MFICLNSLAQYHSLGWLHRFFSSQPLCKINVVIPSVPVLPCLPFLGAVWNPSMALCLSFSVFEYVVREEVAWKRFKISFKERGWRKQVLVTTFPCGTFFCPLMELLEKAEWFGQALGRGTFLVCGTQTGNIKSQNDCCNCQSCLFCLRNHLHFW